MNTLVISQTQVFLIFIFCGCIIGLLFDMFRILRKTFKTPDIITYIEDIVFWLLTCIILAYTILKYNNGELRLFVFIGLFIGITLYILLISNFIIKTCVKFINIIKSIVYKIFKFLKGLFDLVVSLLKIVIKPFNKVLRNVKNQLSKYVIKFCKILSKKDFSKKDFT